jgi:hypothetical protein
VITTNGTATVRVKSTTVAGTVTVGVTGDGLTGEQATITTVAGQPSQVRVGASMLALNADGNSTSDITAQILDINNNLVTSASNPVTFTISDAGTWSDGSVGATLVALINGVATIRIKSGLTTGSITVSCWTLGVTTNTITINAVAGPSTKLTVSVSPSTITADGSNYAIVQCRVSDVNNNLINSYTGNITFGISGDGTFGEDGSVSPQSVPCFSGLATIRVKSTKTAGTITVMSYSGTLDSGQGTLTTVAGPASKLTISSDKQTLKADGADETGLSVYVKDYNDNVVNTAGNSVQMTVGGYGTIVTTAGTTVSSISVNAVNGIVSGLKLRSGTVTGSMNLSVVSYGLAATALNVAAVPGQAAKLSLSSNLTILQSANFMADGISSTTVTIQIQDNNGNAVISPDYDVTLRTNEVIRIHDVSNNVLTDNYVVRTVSGSAVVAIKSTIVSGTGMVTADGPGLISTLLMIETQPKPAIKVELYASPTSLVADGVGESEITARIVDVNGNVVKDKTDMIVFRLKTQTGTWQDGTKTDKTGVVSDGLSTIKVKTGTVAGNIEVEGYVPGLVQGNVVIKTEPGLPSTLNLVITPEEVFADNVSTSMVFIKIYDVNNNPVVKFQEKVTFTTVGTVLPGKGEVDINNGSGTFIVRATNKYGTSKIRLTSTFGVKEINLTVKAKQAAKIKLLTEKIKLTADGTEKTLIQAILEDEDENLVFSTTNTVRFMIEGKGYWSSGAQDSVQYVPAVNGIAWIEVRSSTQAGTITVTGMVEIGTWTVSKQLILTTLPENVPNKIILTADSSELTANGSETVVRIKIADRNYNVIDTADNKISVYVEGQGYILSGTQPVNITYLDAVQGAAQTKIKSMTVAGVMIITVQGTGLELSTMTVNVVSDVAQNLDMQSDTVRLAADGTTVLPIKSVVKDVNGNIVRNHASPVEFSVTGSGMIQLSTSVMPVNGESTVFIRAGVEVGTITVYGRTDGVTGSIKLFTVPSAETKIVITSLKRDIFSEETTTLTVRITDIGGNKVYTDKTVRLSGKGNFSQTSIMTINGETEVLFTGTEAGEIELVAECAGLSPGKIKLNVSPSKTADCVEMRTNTLVYMGTNLKLNLKLVDKNSNKIIDTAVRYVTLKSTNSYGEETYSTTTVLDNGERNLSQYISVPGIYTYKTQSAGLVDKITEVYCLMDRTNKSSIIKQTRFGTIKLDVSANTFDSDAIIEIIKPAGSGMSSLDSDNNMLQSETVIQLQAKDTSKADITDTIIMQKPVTLTIPYPDMDNNGIVDGTKIKEQNLNICKLENNKWVILNAPLSNSDLNYVSVQITKLGVYAILGIGTDPTIDNFVVYPNPFEKNTVFGFEIGSDATVKLDIYTLSGRLINTFTKEVPSTTDRYVKITYDGTDKTNEEIANGTYIYKITTKRGDKQYTKIGKLTKIK